MQTAILRWIVNSTQYTEFEYCTFSISDTECCTAVLYSEYKYAIIGSEEYQVYYHRAAITKWGDDLAKAGADGMKESYDPDGDGTFNLTPIFCFFAVLCILGLICVCVYERRLRSTKD